MKITLLIFGILFLVNLISAPSVGTSDMTQGRVVYTTPPFVNYSLVPTVNSSDFWDSLNTPNDFLLSMFDGVNWIDGDFDFNWMDIIDLDEIWANTGYFADLEVGTILVANWSNLTDLTDTIYVPYTGADKNVDLGGQNLTTTGTGNFTNLVADGDTLVVGSNFATFVGPSYPLATFERQIAGVAGQWGVNRYIATTSGNMVNGFGPAFTFTIKDNADVDNDIGLVGMVRDGADNSGRFTIRTKSAGAYHATGFNIDAQNRMGLGTINPVRDFHLYKNTNAPVIFMVENPNIGVNAHAGVKLANDQGNTDGAVMAFFPSTHATGPNLMYFRNYEGSLKFLAEANSSIAFGIGSSIVDADDLIIDNRSNIGINTSTPTHKLNVVGDVNVTRNLIVWENITAESVFPKENMTGYIGNTDNRWLEAWFNHTHSSDYLSASAMRFTVLNSFPFEWYFNSQLLMNLSVDGDLNMKGNLTLGDKITFRLGEIIDNIVDGWIRITGSLNVNGSAIIGNSSGNVSISNDGQITLHGEAKPVRELIFKATNSVKGSSAPEDLLREVGASGGVKYPVISFSKVTQQDIYGSFHPPDDLDNSVNVEFHLMWLAGDSWTGGAYNWSLEYLVKCEDESYEAEMGVDCANSTTGTPTIISELITPDNNDDLIETEFTQTIDMNREQILIVHFYRDISDNADDVGDVSFFEALYTVNSFGEYDK